MAVRVGVLGATGRMGRTVCGAVAADPDLELVAAVDPAGGDGEVEGVAVAADRQALVDAGAEVAVDFTRPEAVLDNALWCVANGVHVVVGTTGMTPDDLARIEAAIADGGGLSNAFVPPNFAIAPVLMMEFAQQAPRYLPAAEVIELHHDGKVDAPSGT